MPLEWHTRSTTPLAVVVANLSFAQEVEASLRSGPLPTKDLEDCIRDGKEAAERIRLIVKDLKIFSRVEEDKRSAVSAEHVMESAVRMAWNEIRHRAHLVKRYGKVPLVDVNESRLGQVFLNLLVNAAQALPEGQADVHEITILLRTAADGRVVVEVHDSGPGIPPEILGKLFTPFFSTKPAGVGTGLGLAICQRIVAGMGGGIAVESEVGKGTTFRVTLPATTMMATEEMVAPVVRPASRRGRILVVDDEEAIRLVVRRALGKAHDVIACASAQEALEKIAAGESFDIILSDLMMPVMSGVEFYQRLVVVSPEHVERVVFLTGGAFTPSARNFLDEVPNARLNKPFEIQNLRGLVNDRLR